MIGMKWVFVSTMKWSGHRSFYTNIIVWKLEHKSTQHHFIERSTGERRIAAKTMPKWDNETPHFIKQKAHFRFPMIVYDSTAKPFYRNPSVLCYSLNDWAYGLSILRPTLQSAGGDIMVSIQGKAFYRSKLWSVAFWFWEAWIWLCIL